MYHKQTPSWIKHWDFELIDIICLEISFIFSYALRHGSMVDYFKEIYLRMGLNLLIVDIIVVFFLQSYKGILSRNKWQECTATFRHVTVVLMIFLLYEYLIKEADVLSRTVFIASWGVSLFTCYFARVVWKKIVRKKIAADSPQKQILLISSQENIERSLSELFRKEWRDFHVTCIASIENISGVSMIENIRVISGKEAILEYVRQEIVDEVILDQIKSKEELCEWTDLFLGMGITVHVSMGFLPERMPNKSIGRIGELNVITTSIKVADTWELVCKRVMDIAGGLVGIILTGVAFLFVAPAIKKASPGPVFFKQKRVGKSGRVFEIYKFRSMYMDAEERKKEFMKYNEMQGLMFKMENDPRIIGSEKGPGKGIGNFIRRTSIDELPQFWNILKGDMSLVGTRPPTLNEYEQYELHHKIRLSMKPGLTGLWQVSGRNNITDFEEVVKLDTEYIENWSIKLDIKIILKTIKVVLEGNGSK